MDQACVSQKTRKFYGPEKPFVKLRPAYFVKLVFSYVIKGIKIKITAKFRDTEHLRFEDTKRIMSPKSFGTFEKRAPGPFRTGTLHTYSLTLDHACVTGKLKLCFVTGCNKNRKTIRAICTANPIRWLQRRPCAGSHNSWQARHLSQKHVQV